MFTKLYKKKKNDYTNAHQNIFSNAKKYSDTLKMN